MRLRAAATSMSLGIALASERGGVEGLAVSLGFLAGGLDDGVEGAVGQPFGLVDAGRFAGEDVAAAFLDAQGAGRFLNGLAARAQQHAGGRLAAAWVAEPARCSAVVGV